MARPSGDELNRRADELRKRMKGMSPENRERAQKAVDELEGKAIRTMAGQKPRRRRGTGGSSGRNRPGGLIIR